MGAEEGDEVDGGGGAAGEVDPAGAEAGVDAEDDGLGEAGAPLLGNEGVDLAGGVHGDGDEVGSELVADFDGEAGWEFAGGGEGFGDFGFGGLKCGELRVAAGEEVFGGVGGEEELEGGGGVSGGGAAGGVEQGGGVAEGAATELFSGVGELGEGGFVAEIGEKGDGGEPEPGGGDGGGDGEGAPEGEEAGGGDLFLVGGAVGAGGNSAIAGEEGGSGGRAGGEVVVEEEGGDAGEEGVGAAAEVGEDEGFGRAGAEAVEDVGVPGVFVFLADFGGDVGVAGGVEGADEKGCGRETVGVGVGEDVDAGLVGFGEGSEEPFEAGGDGLLEGHVWWDAGWLRRAWADCAATEIGRASEYRE